MKGFQQESYLFLTFWKPTKQGCDSCPLAASGLTAPNSRISTFSLKSMCMVSQPVCSFLQQEIKHPSMAFIQHQCQQCLCFVGHKQRQSWFQTCKKSVDFFSSDICFFIHSIILRLRRMPLSFQTRMVPSLKHFDFPSRFFFLFQICKILMG